MNLIPPFWRKRTSSPGAPPLDATDGLLIEACRALFPEAVEVDHARRSGPANRIVRVRGWVRRVDEVALLVRALRGAHESLGDEAIRLDVLTAKGMSGHSSLRMMVFVCLDASASPLHGDEVLQRMITGARRDAGKETDATVEAPGGPSAITLTDETDPGLRGWVHRVSGPDVRVVRLPALLAGARMSVAARGMNGASQLFDAIARLNGRLRKDGRTIEVAPHLAWAEGGPGPCCDFSRWPEWIFFDLLVVRTQRVAAEEGPSRGDPPLRRCEPGEESSVRTPPRPLPCPMDIRFPRRSRLMDAWNSHDRVVIDVWEDEEFDCLAQGTMAVRGLDGVRRLARAASRVEDALGRSRVWVELEPVHKKRSRRTEPLSAWISFDWIVELTDPVSGDPTDTKAVIYALREAKRDGCRAPHGQTLPPHGGQPPARVPLEVIEPPLRKLIGTLNGERMIPTAVSRSYGAQSYVMKVALADASTLSALLRGVDAVERGVISRDLGFEQELVQLDVRLCWDRPGPSSGSAERYPGWCFFELAVSGDGHTLPSKRALERVADVLRSHIDG